MGYIHYVFCACALLIGLSAHTYAQAPGTSCTTAIPMGKNFMAEVKNGQTVWYSAWTFDLPLTVTFAPKNGASDPAPEVEMDFTCTPGYYEDSILCSLFCPTSSGAVQFDMPHKPALHSKTLDDGTFVYYLSLGKSYRDMLLKMGISRNLEVYVKVTYKCDGRIQLQPDDLFTNCVDNAKFMHFGDTVNVAANDKKRHVIVPYVQWQEDTICYKWEGTTPCYFGSANTCDFDPTDNSSGQMIEVYTIQPGDSVKVSATKLYKWVNNEEFKNEAGMYFAKMYSAQPGVLQVVKIPRAPAKANATLLRWGFTYALNANDTNVYAIPKSWDEIKASAKFTTPTAHLFSMQIAKDPDFSESSNILGTYKFEKTPTGRWTGVSYNTMHEFWRDRTEQYLYVRFICTEATTVLVEQWKASSCLVNTTNVLDNLDTTFVVKRNGTGGNYRVNYSMLRGGDCTATFSAKDFCDWFVANDCNITTVKTTTPANRLTYKPMTKKENFATITADEIESWADKVDAEGYVYMRFEHSTIGTCRIQLTSTAPKDADPVYPTSTIAVQCEDNKVIVRVIEDQTISISDENGTQVDIWDAATGTAHTVTLPVGKYTLSGKTEKIILKL